MAKIKRGISAVQLATMLGTTCKTAWFMLKRIRIAMEQRDKIHQLNGVIEFDDAYFGGSMTGKKPYLVFGTHLLRQYRTKPAKKSGI